MSQGGRSQPAATISPSEIRDAPPIYGFDRVFGICTGKAVEYGTCWYCVWYYLASY